MRGRSLVPYLRGAVHRLRRAAQIRHQRAAAHLHHVAIPPARARMRHAGEVEQGRRDIHRSREGLADRALAFERLAGQERHDADAALGGVRLVEPRRRRRRLRPARAVPDIGIGPPDILQPVVVVLGDEFHQLGTEHRHRLDQRALRAVVRQEQDHRIVEIAACLQVRHEAADVPVDALHHRGIDFHRAGGDRALLGIHLVPRLGARHHRMRHDIGRAQSQSMSFLRRAARSASGPES